MRKDKIIAVLPAGAELEQYVAKEGFAVIKAPAGEVWAHNNLDRLYYMQPLNSGAALLADIAADVSRGTIAAPAYIEKTYYNCTHLLQCTHAIGSNRKVYFMRCHLLKVMPDGVRARVLVHGLRNWREGNDYKKNKFRYVPLSRLSLISETKAA